MDDKLQYIISSFFDDKGFKGLEGAVGRTKQEAGTLSKVLNSGLGRMAAGYMTVSTLANQYNKMVEASNYQLEQETKLYSTMKGQGFRDEQIDSIKAYAGALQEIGVVGDEVTLAGAQQLATFNLTEDSLKQLMPAMQNIVVQQKGLKGTGQDAVNAANMLAKGLLGQTGMLEKAGITLTDYQKQLIKTGGEEAKVGALVEAVTMNVGEQNKEFLKTPEGKIVSAQNRIGDLYEFWGMQIRETRASIWETMGENSEAIKQFVSKSLRVGSSFADTFMKSIATVRRGFDSLSDGSKKAFGLTGVGLLAMWQPWIAGALVVEDVFAAFQGKEAFTEDAINALLKFTSTDYRFVDLRKDIDNFFLSLTDPAKEAEKEMTKLNATLQTTVDVLAGGLDLAQMAAGLVGSAVAVPSYLYDLATEGSDVANENLEHSFAVQNMKAGWKGLETKGEHMSQTKKRLQNDENTREERELREKLDRITNTPTVMAQIQNLQANDGRVPLDPAYRPSNPLPAPSNNNITVTNNITVKESKDAKAVAEEIKKQSFDAYLKEIQGMQTKLGGIYGNI